MMTKLEKLLSPTEYVVLQLIREFPLSSQEELAREGRLSVRGVRNIVQRLEKENVIKRIKCYEANKTLITVNNPENWFTQIERDGLLQ